MVSSEDKSLLNSIIKSVKSTDNANVRLWFDELYLSDFSGGQMAIVCPDDAKAQFLKDNCLDVFTKSAQQLTGHLVTIKFVSENGKTYSQKSASGSSFSLHPDYTFDSFVVGPGNRLCHASCIAVSNSPGDTYNPLFIYGNVGLGKTHLLHAICWEAKKKNAATEIQFLSCEKFMTFFIQAIEQGSVTQFQNSLRSADILIIDDVQFLREREQSQEEFFHTFNALYDNRKQIVLTADCAPGEIKNLEERLVSRFKWGLVASIDSPSYETRIAIVKKKAALRGLDISDDVAEYIAGKVVSNIRELEGAITKVYATAQLLNEQITISVAKKALGEATEFQEKQINISDIIDSVTRFYNVKRSDLQSKKRHQSIALPRQICMFIARNLTKLSLEEIGGNLGGRDHTTVMHAYSKIGELIETDEKLKNQINELTKMLQK